MKKAAHKCVPQHEVFQKQVRLCLW